MQRWVIRIKIIHVGVQQRLTLRKPTGTLYLPAASGKLCGEIKAPGATSRAVLFVELLLFVCLIKLTGVCSLTRRLSTGTKGKASRRVRNPELCLNSGPPFNLLQPWAP